MPRLHALLNASAVPAIVALTLDRTVVVRHIADGEGVVAPMDALWKEGFKTKTVEVHNLRRISVNNSPTVSL